VLLQTVGMILFLSTCCICSGYGIAESGQSPDQAIEQFQDYEMSRFGFGELLRNPGRAGVMLTVVFVTVGGLAMAVFGLGLQAEKRGAGWAALVTTAALTGVLLVAGAGLWVGDGGWLARTLNAVLIVLLGVLTGFSWAALQQVRAHPPSGELHSVPPDFDPKAMDDEGPVTADRLARMRADLERQKQKLEKMEREYRQKDRPGESS
jgi:hypothetical protein